MRKRFNKILASVLVAVMILTAAPLSGFVGLKLNFDWLDFSTKSSALSSSGSCGENVTYTFDESIGLLTISGTGAMKNYSYSGSPFYKNSTIKTVVIENGVTSIGNYAFFYCTGLTNITIPNSVTNIDSYAFCYCTGLTSITIPDSVTSIGEYAFYSCDNLTSITIPDSVISIGRCAFSGCTGLTSVTIPDGVTSIDSWAFDEVNNLSYSSNMKATGSPWGAKSVNGYVDDDIVYNDSSKTVLLVCSSAKTGSITIPDSVTSIGNYAFYCCTGLTSITIPDSVTSIGEGAFYCCTGLTSITIPDSVTSIGEGAFYYCISLTSVTIPDSVTSIGRYAFSGCTGLTSVTIGNSVTSIGDEAFGECISLISVTIGNSVTSIGDWAFDECISLTSVTIGNSVTSIGDEAFGACISLTSITIPDSVTSIGEGAFYYCISLTSVTIPDSVTSIGYMAFDGVNNLSYSANMKATGSPWGAKSVNGYVDDDIVYNDSSKTVLLGCSSAKTGSITIPDSVTSIGEEAFYRCTGLTSVTIPDSVTSIGYYAFYLVNNISYSSKMKATGSPWGAKSVNGYIEDDIVYNDSSKTVLLGCSSAKTGSITIPDSVTSIGQSAFVYCNGLKSITIGKGLKSIEAGTFNHCNNVTDIYYSGTEAEWERVYDGSYNFGYFEITIHFSHSHLYLSVVTAPTCTTKGYTTYTCTCGDSYVDDYVNEKGHDFGAWKVTTPATCTSKGVETRYCSRCEATETRDIEKLAHSYTAVVTAPTCTTKGYTTYTCTCGDSYVADYVEAKGHTDGEWVVTKPATYTETGIRTLYCKDCKIELRTEIIPIITSKVVSVSISNVEVKYKSGATIKPDIKTEGNVEYTVKYETSNPKVATVDDNGNITTLGKGEAKITCTVTDEFGNVVKDTCNVTVSLSFGQWLLWILLFGFLWY